jgi:energy-converting hydrogenase Eha subunit C
MSDSGVPDERPRPAFGEYATPEEQRAHIRRPDPAFAAPEPELPGGTAGAANASPVATGVTQPPVDRIVTIVLLAIGAVNVVTSAFSYLDLPTGIARTMEILGIPGEFTNVAAADTWGAIATIVLVSGYLLTLVWALNRMRAGRLSWWIPVVGAVITFAVVSVCVAVPLWGDPAFAQYIGSMS